MCGWRGIGIGLFTGWGIVLVVDWLFSYRGVALVCGLSNSCDRLLVHIAGLLAGCAAMSSISVDEFAVIDCFLVMMRTVSVVSRMCELRVDCILL